MKVLIASDLRVAEESGRYYMKGQHYSIFKRYYAFFGPLTIYCRVVKKEDSNTDYQEVTDWLAEIIPTSSFYKALLGADRNKLEAQIRNCDLVIGRFHSFLGCVASNYAKRLNKPVFAEVMGDAWDGLWNHSIAGKVIAPYIFLRTRKAIKNADYALYVTNEFLQKRYPCKNPSVGVSNVRIDSVDPQILEKRLEKIRSRKPNEISLMTTAAVDVRYKGQEYVIRAIPLLNKAGLRVKYTLIGGGDQTRLRNVASECGVENQVVFAGRKSLDEVFALLDEADIYIQPSLQEGLPRSVIEAMSRGCPAIGAKTAGIPELIAPECVVKRKSHRDIAKTVIAIANSAKMTELAIQNFLQSKEYLDDVLSQKRNAYFQRIKEELYAH